MENRASYDNWQDINIICIQDLGASKSVTNDIENIICDLRQFHHSDINDRPVMYCDSMGFWDEVVIRINVNTWDQVKPKNNISITFRSLGGTKEYSEALKKMNELYPTGSTKEVKVDLKTMREEWIDTGGSEEEFEKMFGKKL